MITYLWPPVCHSFGSIFNSFFNVGIQALIISEVIISFSKREKDRSLLDNLLTYLYILWRELQHFFCVCFFT